MTDVFWVQVLEPGHPSRIEKVDAEIEVGRDCDGMLVDDPTVSRRHIRLEPTEVGLVVVDLGSANGTFIDGDRIDDPVFLKPGSRLRLGETEIVVHQGHATESGKEGQSGVEVVGDAHRISKEARGLNTAAAKTARADGFRRPDR
ncbi:MAG: FHA domain-containing protein [Actinobacteria bacterium]|nr:FHA domain-containing protein [Actinomycetota bacterium]